MLLSVPALSLASFKDTDLTNVANSILSAYGLPLLNKPRGYKTYGKDDAEFVLEYPKGWIARANSQRWRASCSATVLLMLLSQASDRTMLR